MRDYKKIGREFIKLLAFELIPLWCVIIVTIGVLSGCKTTATGPAGTPISITDTNAVNKLSAALRMTIGVGTTIAIEKRTNSVQYFRLSSAVLSSLILSGDHSPAALNAALDAAPVKALSTPDAKLVIAAAESFYLVYYGDWVQNKIGGNYAAETLLAAVRDGINDGLPK